MSRQQTTDHSPLPLAVDLDGTLVRTDTLFEQWLALLRNSPWQAIRLILALPLLSRSQFKERLAARVDIDPATLPYRQDLLEYLQRQKAAGRPLILATAAHDKIARSIAGHLGLFDEVMASSAEHNLKGANKAAALVEKWGEGGFAYAGDSAADRRVWDRSGSAILVGKPNRLHRLNRAPVEAEFADKKPLLPLLIKQMRLYQWVKNVLVFIPMLAAGRYADLSIYPSALLTFLCFGLLASGVYIVNDLLDLESDRQHPSKRHRPFAAGDLPLFYGFMLAPLLFVTGLGLGFAVDPALSTVLAAYAVITTWYSFHLKTLPLVDVFTLAALYSIRVLGGGVATVIMPSTWLLSFSGLLFLSLAFLKRYIETSAAEKGQAMSRRGYSAGESQIQIQMGLVSSFSSAVVFAIWLDSAAFHQTYSNQIFLWLMTPLILLWQCRLWLEAFREKLGDDPIIFAIKDRASWIIFAICAMLYGLSL